MNLYLLDNAEIEAMCQFYANFKDPTRLKILHALNQKDLTASELCEIFDLTKSNLSHQMQILLLNKLVKATKSGRNVTYSLNDEHVNEIINVAYTHLFGEEDDWGRRIWAK